MVTARYSERASEQPGGPPVTRVLVIDDEPSILRALRINLTAREYEVLTLVALGRSNQEIAEALQLSPLTAKTHVSRILHKLDARDRVQLVVMAYQSGLVASA